MSVFILTWNGSEQGYSSEQFRADQLATRAGKPVNAEWSFGSRRQGASAGDRVFLLRQVSDRGIVASGTLVSGEVFEAVHWADDSRSSRYVAVTWDHVVAIDQRLPFDRLVTDIPAHDWNHILASGQELSSVAATDLETSWENHLSGLGLQTSEDGNSRHRSRLDWTREEVILAMDLYVRSGAIGGGSIPSKSDPSVLALSAFLKTIAAHPRVVQGDRYRNAEGVYLKLTNLRAIETEGRHGMNAYSQLDAAVWRDFSEDLPRLQLEAEGLRQAAMLGVLEAAASVEMSEDVDVEAQHTEKFVINPSTQLREAERREQQLVNSYKVYMEQKGLRVCRRRYRPSGEIRPIYSDLWVPARSALIEAKNSDSREALRLAIGQLFDYRRFHDPDPRLGVLLPYPPSSDRLHLLRSAGIEALWPYGDGFRDSAKGAFV